MAIVSQGFTCACYGAAYNGERNKHTSSCIHTRGYYIHRSNE